MAYNFAKRLKTLRGLTPYEHICNAWTTEPNRFRLNPLHHTPQSPRSDPHEDVASLQGGAIYSRNAGMGAPLAIHLVVPKYSQRQSRIYWLWGQSWTAVVEW